MAAIYWIYLDYLLETLFQEKVLLQMLIGKIVKLKIPRVEFLKQKMEEQQLFIVLGDCFRVISFLKSMDLMDTLTLMEDSILTAEIKSIGQIIKKKNFCQKTLAI